MNTKLLKQRILDLAISGKLVEQNPADEPASELLKRIRKEKEAMVKAGKLKKKDLDSKPIAAEEIPFEVPEGWEWCRMGEIILIRDGERIPLSLEVRSKQNNKVYDYYGATGVVDKVDGYLFDERLLLIGEDGANLLSRTKNNAFFAEGKYWVNNHAHVLDCKEKHILDYIAFFINSSDLEDYITGSAQPKLNQDNLIRIPIPLPPLAEQERIVAKVEELLHWVDVLEENETALNAAAETAKKRILDLAISGKLVEQEGEWKETTLGEVGKWQSGATPSRSNKDYYGGNIPWLKTGDLNDGYITEIPENITEKALKETSVKLNPEGSVLIAMYGATIGKIGILTYPATTNQACCACINTSLNNKFLFYFLLANKTNFIQLGGGGAQANISKEKIVSFPISVPPLAEQERIVAKVEELFGILEKLQKF